MIKLSQSSFEKFLICFLAILPLQLTIRLVLHIPLLVYFFLIVSLVYVLIFWNKVSKYSKILKVYFFILLLFYVEMLISVCINIMSVIDLNIPFEYYIVKYSKFWDSTIMSSVFAGIIRPFVYFTFSLLAIQLFKKYEYMKKALKIMIIIAFISSLYSIYQIIAYQFGLPFASIFSGHQGNIIDMMGVRRCEGILYEPGPQATYLSVIFPLLLCQLFFPNNATFFHKKLIVVMLVTITITLYATFSPIGMLTPVISIPIILWLYRKRIPTKIKMYSPLIFVTGLFLVLIILKYIDSQLSFSVLDYLKSRIINLGKNNAIIWGDDRSVRNEITMQLFLDHKWLGVGPGNDGFYYSLYAPYAVGHKVDKGVAINQNLKILSDSGIFGFLCYILILLYPVYVYLKLKMYKYCIMYIDCIINGMFVALTLFVVLTFNSQVEFFQPLFWIIYSLLLAAIIIKQKNIKIFKLKE